MRRASHEFSVAVDPTNPGQFFACCGLLELADRLWPGAEGWFADGIPRRHASGTLEAMLVFAACACRLTNTMTAAARRDSTNSLR